MKHTLIKYYLSLFILVLSSFVSLHAASNDYNGVDFCLETEQSSSHFIEEFTSSNNESVYSPISNTHHLPYNIDVTEIEEQDDKFVIYTIKINRNFYLPSEFWTNGSFVFQGAKKYSLDHQEYIPLTESKRSILFQVFRI